VAVMAFERYLVMCKPFAKLRVEKGLAVIGEYTVFRQLLQSAMCLLFVLIFRQTTMTLSRSFIRLHSQKARNLLKHKAEVLLNLISVTVS